MVATHTAPSRPVVQDPNRTRGVPPCRRRRWRLAAVLDRSPQAISRVARVLGCLAFADALWPHHAGLMLFSPILPAPARAATDAVVVVSGLLMLRIASGLRRRKRAEWHLAVAVCVVLVVADMVRDERRLVEAAVTVALLALLLASRNRYTAIADPRSRWFAVRVTVEFAAVGIVYGIVLLYLPGHVAAGTTFWQRLWEVVTSLVGMGGWIPIQDATFSDVFHATLLAFGLTAVALGLWFALRASEPIARLEPDDENRLRALLAIHGGRDSLAYFALRRDKSVVWSRSGKAAIAYRVVDGVALISGDPIGDPEAWPGAIDAFQRMILRRGWVPAALGSSELGATLLKREAGLSALELGDEAVLHRGSFTLDGRYMRGVRQACARIVRAGYEVRVRRISATAEAERAQLRAFADRWRVDAVERGFSMALSRVGDAADDGCVVVTATEAGTLRGLLHFVPWGDDGLSLDLMRRDRTSDNGLNEYMIAALMAELPALGVEKVSLNFATFRDVLERGARIGAGPVLRGWRRVLLVASHIWQIDSLYRFNAKFNPEWRPRYLSYPSAGDLPRVAIAALEAERFIVRPRFVDRVLGRARAEQA
jgi:lysyl-tRNA synthetase class 2